MSKLILPDVTYKDSYLQALKELQKEGRELDKDYNELQHAMKQISVLKKLLKQTAEY